MKKGLFLLLLLIPAALGAQSIGQVHYGSRVFSTGLPEYLDGYWDPEAREPVYMPKERLETALECIEWTFGKIASYQEGYDECQSQHVLTVTLDSGDEICFEDGYLNDYTIVSPRFLVGADWIVGGLRVGRKPSMKCQEGVHIEQDEKDPTRYNYYLENSDLYFYCILDKDGRIQEIVAWFNGC